MNRLIGNGRVWALGRAWALIGLGVLLSIAEPSYAAEPMAIDDSDQTPFNTLVVINVVANDTDADGTVDPASVAIVAGPTHGTAVPNGSGAVTYTPATDFSGPDSFSYTVNDNLGETSDPATVTITVQPRPNERPVAIDDSDQTPFNTLVVINVVANDTDADGTVDPASVAIVAGPTHGTAVPNGSGAVTYTPATDFSGPDSFSYTVNDNLGETSDPATVTITVQPRPNERPVAIDDSDQTPFNTLVVINVVANDTDADGTVDLASVAIVAGPTHGTAVPNGSGAVTYTPATDFSGPDSFSYTVNDNLGETSDPATVTITVQPRPNERPVAIDDSDQTPFNTLVVINVVANDTDADGTVDLASVAIVAGPTHGTAVPNGSGAVTYTPATDFSGPDSFSYTVNDNLGETSDPATVTITVQPRPNERPVAIDDSDQTPFNTLVVINVVANDTDADGTVDPASVAIVAGPTHGTAVPNGSGAVTYTPATDFSGPDSFSYTINDNLGAISNPATVTMTVTNEAPVAHAGPDQPAVVALTLVTLNGSASSDPDRGPDPLTFRWGFAQVRPSGSALTDANITNATSPQASFTPDVAGLYRLRLTVFDGELSDSDEVDINATPAPADLELLSLTGTPDSLTVNGQLTYTITVKNNGPGPATGVQVVDLLPSTAVLEGFADSSQGECEGVVCNLGTLAANAEATVTINVIPKLAGELSNDDAHVTNLTAAERDTDLTNNTSIPVTTTVKEPEPVAADLAVTAKAAPGTDGKLTYTLKVTNNGPAIATGVQLTNDLPPDVDKAITWSQGTCHTDADPVLCDLGMLLSDETATVIDVILPGGRTLPIRAAINGQERDWNTENNVALTSALDLPKGRRTTSTCGSKRCKLRLNCNRSGFLGGMCKNRVTLFVDTRARRTTRALQLSDARVARGPRWVPLAAVREKKLRGDTINNPVRLRLTRKGRKIASMLVQQGRNRKRFMGEMRIISASGGQDIMRLWVRLK